MTHKSKIPPPPHLYSVTTLPYHAMHNTECYMFDCVNLPFQILKPDMWPPNSHDLNPVDYAVWGALQQRAYHRRKFTTLEELKRAIITVWQKLSQHVIDSSINEWRPRLECVAMDIHSTQQSRLNLNLIDRLIVAFIEYHSYF